MTYPYTIPVSQRTLSSFVFSLSLFPSLPPSTFSSSLPFSSLSSLLSALVCAARASAAGVESVRLFVYSMTVT